MSCTQTTTVGLGKHESVVIKIDPSSETKSFGRNEYSVDSVCSLSFPDEMIYATSKFVVDNNRIYVLDTNVSHTVYVFDYSGKFLFKLGERGRAKHEYTGEPDDFFVDKMNNIHVFDQSGQKVLSFTKKGQIFRIVVTGEHFPYSFGLTNNNRYAYCRSDKSEDGSKPALMFCNWNDENPQNLIPMGDTYCYLPSKRTFFANDKRLSHIPILSDSVLVFINDSLEKVVHFDFGGRFVTKEKKDVVLSMNKISALGRYNGVWALLEYQETEDLLYLDYIYSSYGRIWLLDKRTGKTINTISLFEGVYPFSKYYLRGHQIIAFADKETVDDLRKISCNDKFKENLLKSAPQVKDLIEGKIKAPALFYISLK